MLFRSWGDGRTVILGTKGYIELRKYVDIAGRPGTNHVFLINDKKCEYVDAAGAGLPYFQNLANDVMNRTETAMPQARCYKAMELALTAQQLAERGTVWAQ